MEWRGPMSDNPLNPKTPKNPETLKSPEPRK